jgi:hypothetical protein
MKRCFQLFLFAITFPFALHAQLAVTNGAKLKLTGDALLTLRDIDLVNNGDFNQTAGTVRFTGTGNSSISGSQLTRIHVLQMAKTGPAQLQLQRTLNINSLLSFSSGIINLNNNWWLCSNHYELKCTFISQSRQFRSCHYLSTKSWVNNHPSWACSTSQYDCRQTIHPSLL